MRPAVEYYDPITGHKKWLTVSPEGDVFRVTIQKENPSEGMEAVLSLPDLLALQAGFAHCLLPTEAPDLALI